MNTTTKVSQTVSTGTTSFTLVPGQFQELKKRRVKRLTYLKFHCEALGIDIRPLRRIRNRVDENLNRGNVLVFEHARVERIRVKKNEVVYDDFQLMEEFQKEFTRGRSQRREVQKQKRLLLTPQPDPTRFSRDFQLTQGPNGLQELFSQGVGIDTQGVADWFKRVAAIPESLNKGSEGIAGVAENMHRISASLGGIEDLPGKFESFSDAARRFAEQGVRISHVPSLSPLQEGIVCLVLFCIFYRKEDPVAKGISYAAALYALYLISKNATEVPGLNAIFGVCVGYLLARGAFKTQGPEVRAPLRLACSLMMVLSRYENYKLPPDATVFQQFMDCTKWVKGCVASSESDYSSVISVLQLFQDLANQTAEMFGSDWRANFTGEYWAELDEMKEQYNQLREEFDSRLEMASTARKVKTLLDRLDKTSIKKSSHYYHQHRDLRFAVNSLYMELKGFGAFGNLERVEPFVIMLSGSPGIGKSLIYKLIETVMARKVLSQSAFVDYAKGKSGNVVWGPNLAENFDSNYSNQPIVLCDDIGFSTDANKVTIPKFISWVNQQPTQTNQAQLERKGSVFFDSKVIIGTTNLLCFKPATESLTTPEAFYRRLHYNIYMELKEEYDNGSGRLDMSKVTEYEVVKSGCWLNYYHFDPATGEKTPFDGDFGALTDDLVRMYDTRLKIHNIKVGNSRDFAQSLIGVDLGKPGVLKQVFRTEGPSACPHFCCAHRDVSDELLSSALFDEYVDDFKCWHCSKFFTDVLPDNYYDGGECFFDHCIDGEPLDKFCAYQSHLYIVCQHRKRLSKKQTMMDWIKSEVSNFVSKVYNKLKEYFGKAWHVLVAGVAGLSAFGMYKKVFSDGDELVAAMEIESEPVLSQARDQAVVDQGRKLVQSNIVWLVTEDNEQIGAGLALGGELILMNRHTLDAAASVDFNEVHVLKFKSELPNHRWVLPKTEVFAPRNRFDLEGADLCVLRIDKYSAVTIKNLFVPAKVTWTAARTRHVSMYFWELDSQMNASSLNMHGPAKGFRAISAVSPSGSKYETQNTIEYDMPTYSGLCGAPIFINDNSLSAKLCGIHIAGHSNQLKGYAAVVTREMIETAFKHFGATSIQTNSNPMIRDKVRHDELPSELIPDLVVVGSCKKKKAVYRSNLVRSPLYKQIYGVQVEKYPAILTPKMVDGILVDPVVENIKGYSRGSIMPNMELYAGARNAMLAHLKKNTRPYNNVLPLSVEQAAMGDLVVVPNLAPLNRSTSCGFPDGEFFTNKKHGVFGDTDWTFNTAEYRFLLTSVNETLTKLKDGPVDFIYSVFPKDELRSKEKVQSLQTRMIMSSSLTETIVTRMYYGNFIDWYMDPSNRLKNFGAIGIDMSNQSDLTDFIQMHGGGTYEFRVLAGDYKGFDKTLSPWLMEIVRFVNMEFMYDYLTFEHQDTCDNIFKSSLEPYLQVGDSLIKWTNSNPSGNVITTPKNCLSNAFAVLQAIADILLGRHATEKEVFNLLHMLLSGGHIRITTFGDDFLMSVRRGIVGGYNLDLITNHSLHKALAKLGLIYTDEEKRTEFDEVDRTIFDVSFLKRRFRFSEEIGWVAYLDIDTILQNIQWAKKDDVDLSSWHEKFETFLNELSVHPDSVWEEYYPRLKVAYENALPDGGYCFSPTRVERMKRWRSRPLLMGEFGKQIAPTDESRAQQAEGASRSLPDNAAREDSRLAGDFVEGVETQQVALGSEAEKPAVRPLVCQGVLQAPAKSRLTRRGSVIKTTVENRVAPENNEQESNLFEGIEQPNSVAINVEEQAPHAIRASKTVLEPRIAAAYKPNDISTVVEYLGKQVPVAKFTWSTADPVAGLLVSQESWSFVSSSTLWMEKLTGYYGMKSTLCLRLEINGTPFHSGRLRLAYYPDASSSSEKWRSHVMSYISISQLPGIEIEANESAVLLRIPYIAVSRFIELTSTKRSWGRIFVAVASPLATGADGVQAVDCRLWAWMEDVELFGQTHKYVTQGPKRIAPSDQEGKPISGMFSNLAKAVGSLSGIPAVSAYTGPTSWALSAMSGAVSAFGWSKPNSQPSVARVYNNPTGVLANFNGEEPVHALSLDADAKLRAIDDVAPSDQDEMSVNYIKTRWSYLNYFDYSTSSSGVDPIYTLDLGPLSLQQNVSALENYLTPIAYLGNMFTMYRGGFEVKIKFAKTALHRGKLQLSYVPGPTPVTNSITESAYLYRTVVDFAEGGEICVTVPYILPLDFIDTNIRFGRLYVHAVTSLNRPETVSASVRCSVYVRGATDLQFVQPKSSPFTPFNDVIVVQGPNSIVNTGNIDCSPIGDAPDPNLDVAFAESSASEVITSVSQLLKRFVHIGLPFNGNPIFKFHPWANKGKFVVAGDAIHTNYHSYVSAPFAFYRGGVKIKLALNNDLTTVTLAEKLKKMYAWLQPGFAGEIFTNTPAVPIPTSGTEGYLAEVEAYSTATAMLVQVPYQGPWRMAPNRLYNTVTDAPGFDQPRCRLVASAPSGYGGLARAYADDFQLLFFVGIPTMAT